MLLYLFRISAFPFHKQPIVSVVEGRGEVIKTGRERRKRNFFLFDIFFRS